MAGAVFAPKLKARSNVVFGIAEEEDDADIRALLRNNPMRGRVTISLEREPNYFADTLFPRTTIVARENRRLVCVGSCSVQQRFVNGSVQSVGYLAGLRLDSSRQGRFDILRRGYGLFRELQADAPAAFYFTSIASDNLQARAFLERNIKGMPNYELLGEFVTLILPAIKASATTPTRRAPAEIVPIINKFGSLKQFAPYWSIDQFQCSGIQDATVNVSGSGAIWDQRSYKQAVIRDYAPALRWTRPIINQLSHLLGRPLLPPIGEQLPLAYATLLHGEDKVALLKTLLASARRCGISLLAAGFDAKDPDLPKIHTQFKAWRYCSRIYVVRWPDLGGSARDLDNRLLGPEVALL